MKKIILLLTSLLFFFAISTASAVQIGFEKLETNTTLPGSQFSAEATVNGTQATFIISNVGPVSSTIFSIYFDDANNVLSSIASINSITGTGVSFDGSTNKGTLPGWSNATTVFPKKADFFFDRNGGAANGIDRGESLEILFNLSGDVLAALGSGDLRLGLHVGRIGTDSDSYISTATPAPPALLLLGTGLIGLAGFRRKSKG